MVKIKGYPVHDAPAIARSRPLGRVGYAQPYPASGEAVFRDSNLWTPGHGGTTLPLHPGRPSPKE